MMLRFKVDSCAHGSSIARHLAPRFESTAAHMAAASLGTRCRASYQLLHALQRCLAPRVANNGDGTRSGGGESSSGGIVATSNFPL